MADGMSDNAHKVIDTAKNVATGIYFARLCIDGKVLQTKRICKY